MSKQPDLNFSHSNFERALDTVLWTYPPNWFITGPARIQILRGWLDNLCQEQQKTLHPRSKVKPALFSIPRAVQIVFEAFLLETENKLKTCFVSRGSICRPKPSCATQ